jgi:cell wall-associated NlpC family hydrolase
MVGKSSDIKAVISGLAAVSLCFCPALHAQKKAAGTSGRVSTVRTAPMTEGVAPAKSAHGRPALVGIKDLADFEGLAADRQKLIVIAIATARDSPWLPYAYGKADPAQGGFDCSGAMYFVMNKAGLNPPRSSAAQYGWLLDEKRMSVVAADATAFDDASLKALKPGDLLFWSTGEVVAGLKTLSITHVALYLGRDKKDGLRIMINATDGRSYRGVKANGYGVYDFRVPARDARSKLVGYGTPPGVVE